MVFINGKHPSIRTMTETTALNVNKGKKKKQQKNTAAFKNRRVTRAKRSMVQEI